MATNVVWNSVTYTIPGDGDEDWGGSTKVDGLIISLAQNALSRAGGSFALTADLDFGGSYGLKSIYYKSRSSNISTTGVVQLANNEGVGWRNAANGADLILKADTSDLLSYNGANVAMLSGWTASRVMTTSAGGVLTASSTTLTQLSYLDATSSIQTQLDAKMPKSGGTFTAAVTFAAGSAASPSALWDTGTGLYKFGTNAVGFASNGAYVGSFDSTGLWTFGISGYTGVAFHTFYSRGLDIIYNRNNTGAYIQLTNQDNNSGSHSVLYLTTKQPSGGDPMIQFATELTTKWSMGSDQSAGSLFTLSSGSALGTTNVITADASGNLVFGTNSSSVVRFNNATQSTVGAAGGASALPATPTGYVEVKLNGTTSYVIPYYAKS